MSNRVVKYVRFQTTMFHPAVGNIGDVLPSPSRKQEMDSLSMYEGEHGLEVTLRSRTLVIPWANIVGYEAVNPPTEAKKAA